MKIRNFFIGLMLLVLSAQPLYLMGREAVTDWIIHNKYSIQHNLLGNSKNIKINDVTIKIIEEPTEKKEKILYGNENDKKLVGDIVKIHLLINDEEVSTPNEIAIAHPLRGTRYFSSLDILTVNDKIVIVQRITDRNTLKDNRQWKIIWINSNNKITEERITYKSRGNNPLAVRLINDSGTSLMKMGYYSDILTIYPTIFYPIVYPLGTGVLGIIMCLVFMIKKRLWNALVKQEKGIVNR